MRDQQFHGTFMQYVGLTGGCPNLTCALVVFDPFGCCVWGGAGWGGANNVKSPAFVAFLFLVAHLDAANLHDAPDATLCNFSWNLQHAPYSTLWNFLWNV